MPFAAWFTVSRQVLTNPFGVATPASLLDMVVGEPWQVPEDTPASCREQFGEIRYRMPPVFGCVQWLKLSGDGDTIFETQLVIMAPDEKRSDVTGTVIEFPMESSMMKTVMVTPPIGLRMRGIYRYLVQLRVKGGEWEDVAAYLFLVVFPEDFQEMKQAAETEQAPVSEGAAS